MANSNYLSNYDKDTVNKLKKSKLLIIDLDGTLINFEKIDNIIIASLFPESRVINSIDNILWKINRLDLFGNGYAGLKLRLAFYSLFSEYTFEECKKEYNRLYDQIARTELLSIYNTTLSGIIDNGYDIAIVTKNVYAKNLLSKNILGLDIKNKKKLKLIVLKKDKKKKFKEMVKQYNGEVCVIGNNLSDDIINSYKIGSPYVYIGKSRVVSIIISLANKIFKKRGIQFENIKKVKSIFTDE